MKIITIMAAALLVALGAGVASAQGADASAINTGDTAFVLMSAALVLLMTPGLAFFYGGLVRRKNVLSILFQCFILICAIGVQWVLFGYSLAFGPDHGGIIGGLDWIGLHGVGLAPNPDYAPTIPHQAFMIFQAMFAIITPALIIGAVVERIKVSGFMIFMLLWATLVYDPVAHWVWGAGGWLKNMGALDFAGGSVVHINAGIAALVMALLIGKRLGYNNKSLAPHNVPFTVLGAGLLWFGWFGFNAGSALSANGLAVTAFVATNTAGASAGLVWALIEWKHNGAPTTLGVATGLVAGLAAVTPACGFISPMSAMALGAIASALCYIAVAYFKGKFGYDDSLDAFGVHGIGGVWGVIATGLFAEKAINPAGADGLFFGGTHLFLVQVITAVVTIAYSGVLTFVLYKAVDALVGIRVDETAEMVGLDITQHKEVGYTVAE